MIELLAKKFYSFANLFFYSFDTNAKTFGYVLVFHVVDAVEQEVGAALFGQIRQGALKFFVKLFYFQYKLWRLVFNVFEPGVYKLKVEFFAYGGF